MRRRSALSRWTSSTRAASTLTEVVPARKATLDGASILSGHLICQYMVDVLSQVEVFDLTGKPLGKVELPGKGTADGFGGNQDDKETFFVFTSYNRPTSIYRYDVLADTSRTDSPTEGEIRSRRTSWSNKCFTKAKTARACR